MMIMSDIEDMLISDIEVLYETGKVLIINDGHIIGLDSNED